MKKLDFVFFDAGGGHRSAATALKAVSEEQGRDWEIDLMNLQEVLDSLDVFRKVTGVRLEDLYNRMLASGWTLGSEYLLPAMQGIIRLFHTKQVAMLTDYWTRNRPDMVVSLVPNLNRAMFEGLQRVDPSIPYVSIITDFADYPPHFWMEKQDQYVICGTERAAGQAREMGYQREKIFLTSGMILRPGFYGDYSHDRTVERERLGLHPDKLTGVMLFGGQGSKVMEKITVAVQSCRSDMQLIAICGKNVELVNHLRALKTKMQLHVVGFTPDVPYYMSLGDFFIGKPGPGSISEAVAMGLPVIVERNSWTLPQERYNAEWVREKHAGIVVESFTGEITAAVDELLSPGKFESYRASVSSIKNRAVYEIPDILQSILDRVS
jgi:1,2-diacylglycerol 3-beta-galactosyltransferase